MNVYGLYKFFILGDMTRGLRICIEDYVIKNTYIVMNDNIRYMYRI